MNEKYRTFFQRIRELDSGSKAALKHSAGIMLAKADTRAIVAFYQCLPREVPSAFEDRWFAVACISCLWSETKSEGIKFEELVSELIKTENLSKSVSHRFEMLLDTDWDQDGYMLTKLTRLVVLIRQKSERRQIDFSILLEDLLHWNAENQYVQRKWAKAIYSK